MDSIKRRVEVSSEFALPWAERKFASAGTATDPMEKAHGSDIADRVADILDPKAGR